MAKTTKKTVKFRVMFDIVFVIVVLVGFILWLLPLPKLNAQISPLTFPAPDQSNLRWPSSGQAALGALGYGLLETHGEQKQVPMASVAKAFTAISVIKQKPLEEGQLGPMLKMDSADVASYNDYYAKGGSVVAVANGEQITEYQALQAMLLPSGNNMADSLARWVFGSVDSYVQYANQLAQQLGLTSTTVADASGFSPATTSNATDLVKIGQVLMNNPVLAQIVNQSQAVVPVAGTVRNTNYLLGSNGIIGIKTGNTDAAGGCLLFATERHVADKKITIIGAVMALPDIASAMVAGRDLAASTDSALKMVAVVKANQTAGYYKLPWGGLVPLAAQKDINLLAWHGNKISVSGQSKQLNVWAAQGEVTGGLTASSGLDKGQADLVLAANIPTPPSDWRIYKRYL